MCEFFLGHLIGLLFTDTLYKEIVDPGHLNKYMWLNIHDALVWVEKSD